MEILNIQQGSEEWLKVRCGLITASNFDKLVTSKGELSKQYKTLLYKLAGEKVTGQKEESHTSDSMQRGIELEAEAREVYEMIKDCEVQEVGFFLGDGFGASPDGLVGVDGLLEIKCPKASTHVSYLDNNNLPTKYIQQVQGQLFVTGRKYCDFMSYYPALKPLIVRVERDEEFIKKLETEINKFCESLNKLVEEIKA